MSRRPIFLPTRKRPWLPTIGSATLHVLLLVGAVGLSHRSAAESEERERPDREPPRIDMIYVPAPEVTLPPPPVPPAPKPEPPPPPPPPPARNTDPEPEPNAPPDATRRSGAEAASDLSKSPAAAEEEGTLESEARRIFGPRTESRIGAGPEEVRPMEAWVADRRERCIPHETPPRNPADPVQLGTVVGHIYRQDTGKPLAGAHLQMVGTPYVAFTDWQGEYRFSFDASLVDNCRTQYVRVSAPGYESRLLVLVVGPNRSEDVLLRRR